MNNKRATKRALLTSVMALVMCVVMLVGTTFAWFTDTASTGVNKIQAGNLDVALEMAVGKKDSGETIWENAEGKTLQFKKAAGAPADEQVLWEPGCTYELPELRVVNKGNLALKYIIKVTGIETNHEVVPGEPNLKDVIDWTIKYGTNKVEDNTGDIPVVTGYSLNPGASDVVTIKGEMDKNAGNEYQGLSIDGISITVYATQYTYEKDSINDQYDANAAYKGSQEFTSGTYTLNKGGVALNPNDVAVLVSGAGTDVTITGGYYDGGSGGNNRCVQVDTGAKVTIKDGTFTVGGDAKREGNSVILCNGGDIVIEGGFFQTDYNWKGFYYVLNQQNGNPGTITVKGGTFVNYDPSKGDDNLGGNFVPAGYSVISETKANGDTWYTVVEGTAVKEPTNEAFADAVASVENGGTVVLPAGDYTIPANAKGKTLTITGTEGAKIKCVKAGEGDYGLDSATVTFKGVTLDFGEQDFNGYVRAKATYIDCTINGRITLGGESTFTNCTFNNMAGYNVWTWGSDATFENCTFNCGGKSVLVYGGSTSTVTINRCTFNDLGGFDGKAAIETGSSYGESFTINIDKVTVNGFAVNPEGISTNSTIWANKNSMPKDRLNVVIDGTKVY